MNRQTFRAKIDAELTRMGYRKGSWIWQAAPARLLVILDGIPREIPIKANMKKEELARQLGRLEGWAEMLGFQPETAKPEAKPRRSRQIDLEEAIAAAGVSA